MLFLPKLELIESNYQEKLLVENFIKEMGKTTPLLHILEAGCGNKWPLDLTGVRYELTGIDRDEAALNLRKTIQKDLHKAIVGDLLTISISEKYDIVYNSFVLEHIEEADKVLCIFDGWLKNKGAIILWIPDPDSVRGFVTRVTPHWFHVFCYKFILKIKNAGKKGYAPYPTYYSPIVSRAGIHKFCAENHYTIKMEYGSTYHIYGKGFMAKCIRQIAFIISLLSFGKLSYKHCNLLYILRKD